MYKLFAKPRWLIILLNIEYWYYLIMYAPVCVWIIWNSIFKTKGFFYPLTLNKAVDETGGFVSADKSKILDFFPNQYKTKYIVLDCIEGLTIKEWDEKGLSFPVFVKPFNLNRGIGVLRVINLEELNTYLKKNKSKLLIENEILLPIEYAVFVVKYPNKKTQILSLTAKKFMQVIGNGKSSIKELLKENERYIVCKKQIDPLWETTWHIVPKKDEIIDIQPVGNHNKGTMFIDASKFINANMELFFDTLMPPKGLEYGRFDVKVNNILDLETGENFKIIEYNASLAEPVSYLDPSYGFIKVQKIIFYHYRHQFKIAKELMKAGIKAPKLKAGLDFMFKAKKFKEKVESGKVNEVF